MNSPHLRAASSVFLSLVLISCGGGSGGGSSSTPQEETPPPPPPEEAPLTFHVSGTVTASSNLAVDSDNNNPDAIASPNNTPFTAQRIASPVTLGGYVAEPNSGTSGAIQPGGDLDDFFAVTLLAGQIVTVLVADHQQADVDLYLYNSDGEIIDFSILSGEVETLRIPASGNYYVNVFAFEGASNYLLAVGTESSSTQFEAAVPNNIIPWQAITQHRPPDPHQDTAQLQTNTNRRFGMRGRSRVPRKPDGNAGGRPQLMTLEHSAASQVQQVNRLGKAKRKQKTFSNPALLARWETLMTIKSLRADPNILLAEPNYRVTATAIPNDEAFPYQWHLPLIGLPSAWDITAGAADVLVAVIDTGILGNHPDLRNKLVPGYDFISDSTQANDGDGIDPNPEDTGGDSSLGSGSFHGSHVAGTIAAESNNSVGVSGVSWYSRIMPLRVLGQDGGSSYDVDQAIRFAAGLANDSGTVPEAPADIINLSLGGAPFSPSSQSLIDQVREAGIAVVAAAGNEDSSRPSYPASYEGVISVAAVDSQRRIAPYSNFGSHIDIAAPGGDDGFDVNGDGYPDGVLSTAGSTSNQGPLSFSYSFLSGTSMASPHVSGVIALMKSVNPQLSPDDIDALLAQGKLTDDLGTPGRDNRYGYGLVNAFKAVSAAANSIGVSPGDTPRLSISPSVLSFGATAESLELVLRNSGLSDLTVSKLTTSESWLAINPLSIDGNGLGSYRVRVDRSNLAPGLYSAQITAASDVNDISASILLSVIDVASAGDVGVLYVLLIASESGEAIAQHVTTGKSGSYSFHFEDIPEGDYEIFAGTDADNDLIICDAGEACGAYLTVVQPLQLDVDSDKRELDFPIEYQISITGVSDAGTKPGASDIQLQRQTREILRPLPGDQTSSH